MEWTAILIYAVMEERNRSYRKKQEERYKYDDRWEEIQNRANKIIIRYYEFLLGTISIGALITHFTVFEVIGTITLTANIIFFLAFICLAFKNIVELIALRYFDSKV